MSKRIAQVESTLQRAIAEVIQRRVSDPRIAGMVSVTRVEVTPDLKHAVAHVSVMPETYQRRTIGGLKAAQRHIQSLTGKLVAFPMPHLRFELDRGLKREAGVYDAIKDANRRTGETEDRPADASAPAPDAT